MPRLRIKIDNFTKSIVVVFIGISCANFLNLIFQLLLAHKLNPSDFAAFNSLLSILMLFSTPVGTINIALVKYISQFNASNNIGLLKNLLSVALRKCLMLAFATFGIFFLIAPYLTNKLKIPSITNAYLLAGLLAISWLLPLFTGGLQGLELFKWFSISMVSGSILKVAIVLIFLQIGLGISAGLWSLFISSVVGMIIAFFALKRFISFEDRPIQSPDFKELLAYLFPVAASSLCFMGLVSIDMVLVKYYFNADDAGFYSLSQMIGKIFLFLPAAISLVMFPRTSGLSSRNMDTLATLKKSLFYASMLCLSAIIAYNLFPAFTLKVLTGKAYPESILLGRLFALSMAFFSLIYILMSYFLSIKDMRFLKYLAIFISLEVAGIVLFHRNIIQIQIVLCVVSILLFVSFLLLLSKRKLNNSSVRGFSSEQL